MKGGDPAGAYAYSLFGNQMSYTPNGVLYIYYTYRPDGLRHSIGDKVHVWDGANIVADVDGNDISVYIRGANLIYADDGNIIYYHFNAHGDVVALTNENGAKTKSYAYSAFGVEYTPSDFDDNPFRYCGEYFDKETNTIYLRARYYNAEQGRFTQEDPIRDGDNWYSYCGGNPIMFVDPSGLSKGFSEKNRIITQKLNEYLSLESPSSSESLVPPSTNFSVEQQNDLSTGLLIAAGVSAAADGPLPIGDIVGIVLFGIAAVTAMMTTSTAITTAPPISLPEIRIKSKSEKQIAAKVEADVENNIDDDDQYPVVFPQNPYYFNPKGLIMKEFSGSYNGKIIKWFDPTTNIAIFEWNEDFQFGSHYHILIMGMHDNTHKMPNEIIPEPYQTIYFK